jgi:lycopene beta-cyclase
MDRFQYLMLMGGCVLITLPLEFVFDARVYRRPRRLARALVPVVAVFYLWDALAIARGHWWFDRRYVTGVELPLGVPLEELVFFVVIPICALLTMESVRNLLDGRLAFGRDRTVEVS